MRWPMCCRMADWISASAAACTSTDYDIANVPMNESRERFDENLAIIRALWTQDRVTHHGRWTTVDDHTLGPRPVQQPAPPIWVAAVPTEATYAGPARTAFIC